MNRCADLESSAVRLCMPRFLAPVKRWGATIPAPVAAVKNTRNAASQNADRYRGRLCTESTAFQSEAIRYEKTVLAEQQGAWQVL